MEGLGVSRNVGTPKSSILIGVSIINHPFWGTTIFGNTQVLGGWCYKLTQPMAKRLKLSIGPHD